MTKRKKIVTPLNGYFMLLIFVLLFFGGIVAIITTESPWFGIVYTSWIYSCFWAGIGKPK